MSLDEDGFLLTARMCAVWGDTENYVGTLFNAHPANGGSCQYSSFWQGEGVLTYTQDGVS